MKSHTDTNKKFGLIILDGWGIGKKDVSDAIFNAKTPVMDELLTKFPHCSLTTFGEDVGLPEGQMGNSEVGHLNIGAGRVVYQELTRINKSIREGHFFELDALKQLALKAKTTGKKVHLIGLLSNGGVHSSMDHLFALIDFVNKENLPKVCIHVFLDGRDCDPKSGEGFVFQLQQKIQGTNCILASVIGRYYAMDRDKRWERIKKAYDLLVHGTGASSEDILENIQNSYENGITDEFFEPTLLRSYDGQDSDHTIDDGDSVLCFNFRTDRPREITEVLSQRDFPEYEMSKLNIDYYSMTSYDDTYRNVTVLFEKDKLKNTLGEVLQNSQKTQLRIAETEKYPHVTFFFNGGREAEFHGEKRLLINSPKVATYDLQPSMGAVEITDKAVQTIQADSPDFFCLNFANPDMVGHTGVYNAIIEAVECVDECLGKLVKAAVAMNYELLIIADHGNADFALNSDGTPNTAHTVNPVPCILVSKQKDLTLLDGKLADIAPTILSRMNIEPGEEMNGKILVQQF
jgi:2,3-bisphosphoglycerate-independent phosphoglycerate mutase